VLALLALSGCARSVERSGGGPEIPVRLLGCRLESSLQARGVLFPRGVEEPLHQPVEAREGHLSWYVGARWKGRVGPGQGVLSLEGHEPLLVTWEAGAGGIARCHPAVLALQPATSFVSGRVHTADGSPVTVVGCGGHARTARDGTFRMAVMPDEPCTLWAGTMDGYRWGGKVEIVPIRGQQTEVRLSSTPWLVREVLGIDVAETRDGLLVVEVHRPAGGHVLGDLLVSIDGLPLGEEGEPVWLLDERIVARGEHTLVVIRDGQELHELFIVGER
jgi:hypothetical protein